MAERFNERVQLGGVATGLGAAGASLSLVDKLEGFKTQAFGAAEQRAIQRGAQEARETALVRMGGITQAPEFKEVGFFGSVEAQAHNKTLRAGYLASLDNDNRAAISDISARNSDNLIKFNDEMESYAKSVINSVDPSIRQLVAQDLEQKIITARGKVQAADIKRQKDISLGQIELAAQDTLDDSLLSAREGDITASGQSLQDLFAIYDGQVESGLLIPSEAELKKRDAELKVTREVMIGGVKQKIKDGDFNGAIEAIVKTRERVPKGFTIEEHDEVITAMTSEVNEALSLNNKLEDEERELSKSAQQSEFVSLYTGIAQGTNNVQDVLRKLNDGKISPEQATKLTNILNTRGKGIDDWSLVTRIQDAIENGEDARDTIIANSGTNLTEATAASLLAKNDQEEDTESPLQTNLAKRGRAFIKQSMRVTGPFGALDQEAERRMAQAVRDYDDRVLAGEDPWVVADQLVGKDDLERAPNPMFGTKDNLENALQLLNDASLTNQIDDDTYNFQFGLIERLKALQDNINSFDKARKESVNANR